MDGFRPSRTALRVALYRAHHQTLEQGAVFADPFANAIAAAAHAGAGGVPPADPADRGMRLFVAARGRIAEDALAEAAGRGVRQAVVLGAGLDTFALRNPHAASGLRVFEVDHPATQAWKRECLAAAGIDAPRSLAFVPVDFERDPLADALAAAGFRAGAPAFFVWLGVVPYLSREAIFATLGFVATVPRAEIVFDYAEPPETLDADGRAYLAARAARVAAVGEPWITFFVPGELASELRGLGFDRLEDWGGNEIAARLLGAPPRGGRRRPGHVMHAAKGA